METERAFAYVYQRLAADATLATLLSGRIYRQGHAPANTAFPYVEVAPYAETPGVTIDGTVFNSSVRLQAKCWGQNTASATLETIMDRIRFLLDRQKGSVTNGEIFGCNYLGSPPLPPSTVGTTTYTQYLSEFLIVVQQAVLA